MCMRLYPAASSFGRDSTLWHCYGRPSLEFGVLLKPVGHAQDRSHLNACENSEGKSKEALTSMCIRS